MLLPGADSHARSWRRLGWGVLLAACACQSEHPESVAGLVLVDASPDPPPLDQLPPEMRAEFERGIARLEGLDLPTMRAGFDELAASKASLGNKPLVVLVAGRVADEVLAEGVPDEARAAARLTQRPLTSGRRARRRIERGVRSLASSPHPGRVGLPPPSRAQALRRARDVEGAGRPQSAALEKGPVARRGRRRSRTDRGEAPLELTVRA